MLNESFHIVDYSFTLMYKLGILDIITDLMEVFLWNVEDCIKLYWT